MTRESEINRRSAPEIRYVGPFSFRDSSHAVGRYWHVDWDLYHGEYNLSESALTSLRSKLGDYWSKGRPKSYWEAIGTSSIIFRVRREDRGSWEKFLERLLADPKNAVDCCPEVRGIPQGMSA